MPLRPLRPEDGFVPIEQPAAGKKFRPLRPDEEVIPVGGNPRLEALKGASELAATLGSGVVVGPTAGIGGLIQGVVSKARGEEDVTGAMADRIRQLEGFIYSPRTEAGQAMLSGVGKVVEPLNRLAVAAGRGTQDIGGGAAGGAAAETAVNMVPALLGTRSIPANVASRSAARQAIADVERNAARQGIDINASGTIQREQLVDAARRQTGGQAGRGEPFPDIRDRLIAQKNQESAAVDQKYAQARESRASVPADAAGELSRRIRTSIAQKEFDIESMPILRKRLDEIGRLEKLPEGSAVKLNAIDAYRRRLGRNRAPATDSSQNLALDTVRRSLDDFVDEAFDADMIRGDQKAIQKWKDARAASSNYMARFKDDKVIKKMIDQEATPEQMRQWVFGASAVGAKPQSAEVVKKLGDIIGKDSPQFSALRQDALFDIMEPLLRPEPSLKQFAKNYDRMVRTNPSLVNELFPDSGKGLRDLRVIAEAVEKRAPDVRMVDLNRMAAVALFGHGISKAAMKVSLASQVFSRIRAAGAKSEKQRIMGEVLGYDPSMPMIPKRVPVYASAGPAVTGEIERQSGQRNP